MKRVKGYSYLLLMVVVIALFVSFFSYALRMVVRYNETLPPIIIFLGIPVIIFTHYLYKNIDTKVNMGVHNIYQKEFSDPQIPIIHSLYISIATLLSHLAGVSVGREGVAVQIGATIASSANHYLEKYQFDKHTIICMGIATGFSTFFGTPLTAVLFAIEVGHYKSTKKPLNYLLIIISSYIGFYVSHMMNLTHLHIEVGSILSMKLLIVVTLLIITLLVLSYVYIYLFYQAKKCFVSIKANLFIKRVTLTLILCAFIYFLDLSNMRGLGTQLISMSIQTPGDITYIDPILKLILTISFVTIGFKGGEVTPIFAIGAMCGAIASQIFQIDNSLLVVCGIATFFMFTTNTRWAGILLILELSDIKTMLVILPIALILCLLAPKKGIYQI